MPDSFIQQIQHLSIENTVLVLFLVVALVAIGARRLRMPYTVSLVLAGLGLGTLHLLSAPVLDRQTLFTIFLPGLVFEASINMRAMELWRERFSILTLALPGVILGIGLTAAILILAAKTLQSLPTSLILPINWPLALIFGAAIAATDPITVVALFRSLGIPRRLLLILEGESLFNDGTAIVFFGLVLTYLRHRANAPVDLVAEFLWLVGGGFLVGAMVGGILTQVIRRSDDAMVEITLTTVIAYASFLIASQMGVSGVISTVAAGLVFSARISEETLAIRRQAVLRDFWEYLGFLLNSMVFLLMGFEIQIPALLHIWPLILVSWVAATLARGSLAAGVSALLKMGARSLPRSWAMVLTWGGLRGGLSMVLAMSLPASLPGHALIVNLVFGFVLLTIIVQGMSMTPLVRYLGLVEGQGFRALEIASSRWRNIAQMLPELERLRSTELFSEPVMRSAEEDYQKQLDAAEAELGQIHVDAVQRYRLECRQLRARLLNLQMANLREAYREGRIDAGVFQALFTDLDLRMASLDSDCSSPPPVPGPSEEGMLHVPDRD